MSVQRKLRALRVEDKAGTFLGLKCPICDHVTPARVWNPEHVQTMYLPVGDDVKMVMRNSPEHEVACEGCSNPSHQSKTPHKVRCDKANCTHVRTAIQIVPGSYSKVDLLHCVRGIQTHMSSHKDA